jgi:hypothetical protein
VTCSAGRTRPLARQPRGRIGARRAHSGGRVIHADHFARIRPSTCCQTVAVDPIRSPSISTCQHCSAVASSALMKLILPHRTQSTDCTMTPRTGPITSGFVRSRAASAAASQRTCGVSADTRAHDPTTARIPSRPPRTRPQRRGRPRHRPSALAGVRGCPSASLPHRPSGPGLGPRGRGFVIKKDTGLPPRRACSSSSRSRRVEPSQVPARGRVSSWIPDRVPGPPQRERGRTRPGRCPCRCGPGGRSSSTRRGQAFGPVCVRRTNGTRLPGDRAVSGPGCASAEQDRRGFAISDAPGHESSAGWFPGRTA